jgi:death-on-curing protein
MKTPVFLTLDQVLTIYKEEIRRLGGSEGLRDMGLMQSALAKPSAEFGVQFLHEDIYLMAADAF